MHFNICHKVGDKQYLRTTKFSIFWSENTEKKKKNLKTGNAWIIYLIILFLFSCLGNMYFQQFTDMAVGADVWQKYISINIWKNWPHGIKKEKFLQHNKMYWIIVACMSWISIDCLKSATKIFTPVNLNSKRKAIVSQITYYTS